MSEINPRPWKTKESMCEAYSDVEGENIEIPTIDIVDANGETLIGFALQMEDEVNYIVKAVNDYDILKQQNKQLEDRVKSYGDTIIFQNENKKRNDNLVEYAMGVLTQNKKLREAISTRDEYIDLLNGELNELVPFAHGHCWRSTRAEKGQELREKIALLDGILEDLANDNK